MGKVWWVGICWVAWGGATWQNVHKSQAPKNRRHLAIWPRGRRQGIVRVHTVILHPFSLDLGEYGPRYEGLSGLHDM